MRRMFVALTASLLPLAAAAGSNLVVDGSFEDYAQARGTWGIYSSGHGWTTGSGGIEIRDSVSGTAADGSDYAELDTTRNSTIYQDIATTAGEQYLLSFSYSNRSGVAVTSNGLSWSFGSQSGDTAALAYNNSGNNQWSSYSVLLTATSSLTRLTFSAAGTSDSYGSSLDNIQLVSNGSPLVNISSSVPEPASAALLLAGLGVLAARRRRQG